MARTRPPVPDLRRLLMRRQIRRGLAALVAAIIGWIALCNRPSAPSRPGDDHARFDRQTFVVDRVIDGDTVSLRTPGGGVHTRLIGIDAPEMHYENGPPDYWARQATDALRGRVEGKRVYVRLQEVGARDKYGRLLAYLYPDEKTVQSVNLWLIETGNAYAHRRIRHEQRVAFESAETEARKRRRGLWENAAERQMPAWRQDWLRERRERSENAN